MTTDHSARHAWLALPILSAALVAATLAPGPADAHVSHGNWYTGAAAYTFAARSIGYDYRTVTVDLDVEQLGSTAFDGIAGGKVRANVVVKADQAGERVSADRLELYHNGARIEVTGQKLGPRGYVNQYGARWRGPTCGTIRAKVLYAVRWRDGRLTKHSATTSTDRPVDC
jgi:hypothetical protein